MMNDLNALAAFASEHQAAFTVAAMWAVRETRAVWQKVCRAWPWVIANGGLGGIYSQLFHGGTSVPANGGKNAMAVGQSQTESKQL